MDILKNLMEHFDKLHDNENVDVENMLDHIDEIRKNGQIDALIDNAKKALFFIKDTWGDMHPYYIKVLNGLAMTYHSIGLMKDAEPLYLEILEQFQENRIDNEDHIFYLNNLALLYHESGRLKEAEPLFKKVIKLTFKTVGNMDIRYATCLHNLGSLYHSMGRLKIAKKMLLKSMIITYEVLGTRNSDYAVGLESLVDLYLSMGDLEEAERICKKALKVRKILNGNRTPKYARCLNKLAQIFSIKGSIKGAERIYRLVMKIDMENKLGGHPNFGKTLQDLAGLFKELGRYEESEVMYHKALKINRDVLGDLHMNVASCIHSLATLYIITGRYQQAESLLFQSIDIKSKVVGERNYEYALSINGLAELYSLLGRFREAEQLYRSAQSIIIEVLGEKSLQYAMNVTDIANLYTATGRFTEAEELYYTAARIRGEVLGSESKHYAITINNLAYLYYYMGRYEDADQLYEKALLIISKVCGQDNSDYATSLFGRAMVGQALGQYEESEPLYLKTLNIKRNVVGEMHPEYATNMCNLAMLYHNTGRHSEAEEKYLHALMIRRVVLGDKHPDFALNLNNLAVLYQDMGRFAESESLLKVTRNIVLEVLGDEHPLYATNLNNLAWLYQYTGNFTLAEELYLEGVQKMLHSLGDKHPDYAAGLSNLGCVKAATGHYSESLNYLCKSIDINNMLLERLSAYLPEQHLLSFTSKLEIETFLLLSLVFRYLKDNSNAVKIALDTVIKRKAIVHEVTAVQHQFAMTCKHPHLEDIFEETKQVRTELARRILSGPEVDENIEIYKKNLEQLDFQLKQLHNEIARQVPKVDIQMRLQSANREAISEILSPNSILVEFVRFVPIAFEATGSEENELARYIAFIITSNKPEEIFLLDFGVAEQIDLKIGNFRKLIIDGECNCNHDDSVVVSDLIIEESRAMYDIFFAPIIDELCNNNLKGIDHIIIAPDGEICQIPFEAFISSKNRFVIQDYNISYVTVGRDIVRFGFKNSGTDEAVIIADPEYNLTEPGTGKENTNRSSSVIVEQWPDILNKLRGQGAFFPRLPYTRQEGIKVAKQVRGLGLKVKEFYGNKASKRQVKETKVPKILHIATHGFFLPDKQKPIKLQLGGIINEGKSNILDYIKLPIFKHYIENPLLRSGLVFAGINTVLSGEKPPEEAENGILTALEVLAMNFIGTELVVLSACQTGMGEVHYGEGVAGLRKSFILGGAKTLLISLWEVPDKETKILMELFYSNLFRGEDKSEALRKAKLELINKLRKDGEFANPWYWAGFICLGDSQLITQ